ncbi:MAG: hypothetical protein U0Q07_07785 [Acidimicrobiales bacterium]
MRTRVRLALLLVLVLPVGLVACSKPPDVDPNSIDVSGVKTLTFDQCVELTEARAQLLNAPDAAAAQAAADTLRRLSPPPGVGDAIAIQEAAAGRVSELGSERGQRADAAVTRWVAKACPMVAPS